MSFWISPGKSASGKELPLTFHHSTRERKITSITGTPWLAALTSACILRFLAHTFPDKLPALIPTDVIRAFGMAFFLAVKRLPRPGVRARSQPSLPDSSAALGEFE